MTAVAAAAAQSLGAGIRPMTMSPVVAMHSNSAGGGSLHQRPVLNAAPDADSGGFQPRPPIIRELDVINGIQGTAPNYTYAANGVPVGEIMSFEVESPGGDFATISWSGGSNYASYFALPATTAPAPVSMSLGTNPYTQGQYYDFIVGATEQAYNVSVKVTYTQDAGQPETSTVTFNSHRPAATMRGVPGVISFLNNQPQQGQVELTYQNGMTFTATTPGETFGGNYMFMQTMVLSRQYKDSNGVTHSLSSNGAINIDDGLLGNHFPIGLAPGGWSVAPNGTATQSATDSPRSAYANIVKQFSVGDSLVTYLMYQPPGGDWVALKQGTWTFTGAASNPWPQDYSNPAAAPSISSPGSGSEFPGWNGRTGDAVWVP
jgi:hypothetical protein